MELTIIDGAQLALNLPAHQSFADWRDIGAQLCGRAKAINWLIGDWLIAGVERYGEQARDAANALFRADVERLHPIVQTCRAFPGEERRAALSFGHHAAVATIDHDEAARLLEEAERDRLTVAALKARARVQAPRLSLPDDDPEDLSFRRIVQAWNLASREARAMFLESAEECDLGVIEL